MLNIIKHLQYTDGKLKVDQHSVLNGLHNENLTVIYDRFTFLELKNDEKNYMLTYSFFCYSTPIAISLENVPNSQYSAYGRKYYHIFKSNVSSAHI